MSDRQFYFPSPQGDNESIPYTFDASQWGISTPSSPAVVIKDGDGEDITSDHVTGSASVSGSVITFPLIHSLVSRVKYRVELSFTSGGATYSGYGFLYGED